MGTAMITSKGGGVEIEIVFLALVADREVVAKLAANFARLAGAPRGSDGEGADGAGAITVELVIILGASLQADGVAAVPPQAPRLRRVEAARLSQKHVAVVVKHAPVHHQDVAIDADQAMLCSNADITSQLARETLISRGVKIGLGQASALPSVMLVVECFGAAVRPVWLHVGRAIAVDRAETDRIAASLARQAVSGARTCPTALDRLRAIQANRSSRVIKPSYAQASPQRQEAIPSFHTRFALGREWAHASVTGVGAGSHRLRGQLVVEGSGPPEAQRLRHHVTLIGRTALRLKQDVSDVDLHPGVGVIEDVGESWQVERKSLPPFNAVKHGKGEVVRVFIALNGLRVLQMDNTPHRTDQVAWSADFTIHQGLIHKHSHDSKLNHIQLRNLNVQQVGVAIIQDSVDIQVGCSCEGHVGISRKNHVEQVLVCAVERRWTPHQIVQLKVLVTNSRRAHSHLVHLNELVALVIVGQVPHFNRAHQVIAAPH